MGTIYCLLDSEKQQTRVLEFVVKIVILFGIVRLALIVFALLAFLDYACGTVSFAVYCLQMLFGKMK